MSRSRMLRVGEKVRPCDHYLGGAPRRWRRCLHDLGRRVTSHGQATVPVRRPLRRDQEEAA